MIQLKPRLLENAAHFLGRGLAPYKSIVLRKRLQAAVFFLLWICTV